MLVAGEYFEEEPEKGGLWIGVDTAGFLAVLVVGFVVVVSGVAAVEGRERGEE